MQETHNLYRSRYLRSSGHYERSLGKSTRIVHALLRLPEYEFTALGFTSFQ